MADLEDKTIPELTAIDTPAVGDMTVLVDISDTTDSAVGSSKRSTLQKLSDLFESLILTATKIKTVLGITTLSGDNTGDQDLDGYATLTGTETLENKRNNSRIISLASYTTDTGTSLSVATADVFQITAQAGDLKFNNPSGTPVAGQKLIIRIKDDGTARALTYDTQFRASTDLPLPSTTVLGKTLYMGFIFNATDTKWDLLAVLNNF